MTGTVGRDLCAWLLRMGKLLVVILKGCVISWTTCIATGPDLEVPDWQPQSWTFFLLQKCVYKSSKLLKSLWDLHAKKKFL